MHERAINHTFSSASVDTLWAAALCVSATPSAVTFLPSCRWPSDGLPPSGSPPTPPPPPHHTTCHSPASHPPIGCRCSSDQMAGPTNWPLELRGGGGREKEGIDLSVVLEDQLIPIVCASTDSPMCLIRYGLFLLGQDKSRSHH